MDYREIQRLNLKGKNKKEIIEFLTSILGEYGIVLEYSVLKEILTPEQIAIIDKAIETDSREFAAEDPDFTEEDIQEWLKEDSVSRRLVFSKNEDGKTVISDFDARMQDTPNIEEMFWEDVDVSKFLDVVQQGFKYTLGFGGKRNDLVEINALQEKLTAFSKQLSHLNQIKSNLEMGGAGKVNALLSLLQLTSAQFNMNEVEALVAHDDVEAAKEAIQADAYQLYPNDGRTPENQLQSFRKEYSSDFYYNIGTIGNEMALRGQGVYVDVPNLSFDSEKIATPEFQEKLMEIAKRNKDLMYSRLYRDGYYSQELKGIIDAALGVRSVDTKQVDVSKFVKKIAREEGVLLQEGNAQEFFSQVISKVIGRTNVEDRDTGKNNIDLEGLNM